MECTDACPHEPHLLLAGSDDLLAIAKRGLQGEPISDRRQDLSHGRIGVGAEEGHPPIRLVHQHDTDDAADRPPRRDERLVPLLRRFAVELEDLGRPAATLPGSLGQLDAVLPVDPRSARRPATRGPGIVHSAASLRSRLTTVIPSDIAGFRNGALAYAPSTTTHSGLPKNRSQKCAH